MIESANSVYTGTVRKPIANVERNTRKTAIFYKTKTEISLYEKHYQNINFSTAWLHVIMKYKILILSLVVSFPTLACEEIFGKYKSVSETHWNFELEIAKDNTILLYTDYFYGERDTRTDQTIKSHGYCEKIESGYKLSFAQISIEVKYQKALSHTSFGGNGSSPGITGEFIKGQQVELWQNL